jgi:hypothetical protein
MDAQDMANGAEIAWIKAIFGQKAEIHSDYQASDADNPN